MLNVECMTCMTVGLDVGSMDPPSRAARLHAEELWPSMQCSARYYIYSSCLLH